MMEGESISDDDSHGRDLPMEVVQEILIYLHVKLLIRFTCVCKSWLNLIRHDHQFAIRHYLFRTTKQSRLMDKVKRILEYPSMSRKVRGSKTSEKVMRLTMYSITERKTFRVVKKIECGPSLNATYSNVCHGMFCAYVSASTRGDNILICNPAIGEVAPIPSSIKVSDHSHLKLGLGFDPINNDYKIIMVVQLPRNEWLVGVYSVRNSCWHKVEHISELRRFFRLEGQSTLNGNGCILNWLGCQERNMYYMSLLSFDIVDEVFKVTSLPECCPHYSRNHVLLSSTRCLACLICSPCPCLYPIEVLNMSNESRVWVLNDPINQCNSVWNKHVSFGFPDQKMVVWPMNVWMNDNQTFVHVPEKTGGPTELFCYDIGSQELKRTGRLGIMDHCSGYSESLVSIKGLLSSSSLSSSSLSSQQAVGSGYEDEYQGHEDDGGFVCFIREVGKRNDDIRWSYSFKLLN